MWFFKTMFSNEVCLVTQRFSDKEWDAFKISQRIFVQVFAKRAVDKFSYAKFFVEMNCPLMIWDEIHIRAYNPYCYRPITRTHGLWAKFMEKVAGYSPENTPLMSLLNSPASQIKKRGIVGLQAFLFTSCTYC